LRTACDGSPDHGPAAWAHRSGIRDIEKQIGLIPTSFAPAAQDRPAETCAIEIRFAQIAVCNREEEDWMPRTRQAKLATVDVVEDVARHVPGYRGYLEPSQRREDDRRFRSSIAEHLKGEAHRLERIESKQFRDDFSDLLEELDGDARKLEFLADSVILIENGRRVYADDVIDPVGRLDRDIVERIERLHRLVHELEKAYEHDEQFEMNLAELRELTEAIADLIEQRNVALTR
jgi:hypothetical protein